VKEKVMSATLPGSLRKRFLAPDTSDAEFATLGFALDDAPARAQLEHGALQLLMGYEFGIEQKGHAALVTRLETLQREYRGFAYEGAAMALTIRDVLSPVPGNTLTETFLAGPGYDDGPGSKHLFMAYLGIGFALGRLPRALWRRALPEQSRLADHPSLRWLILDGYGFHMAFFHHRKWVDRQYTARTYPWPGPADYTNRVVDQGIGRAMWFVHGGNVERLLTSVGGFPPARRADLMSGVGLAATYAGGVTEDALEALVKGSAEYRADIALGAVLALRARVVADLATPYSETAARVLCHRTAEQASEIAVLAITDLPADGAVPAYEVFRQRIRNQFR
jgi:hypothetical protein